MNQEAKLYVRREPTTDPSCRSKGINAPLDSVAYQDRQCLKPIARWPWHLSNCPDRRFRYAIVNCSRYRLEWLPGKPS